MMREVVNDNGVLRFKANWARNQLSLESQPEKECDTAHGLDEFHLFPWWRITDDTGLSAGGIVGGKDFNPCVPHIDFFKEGSHYVDAWEIPLAMEKLLKSYFEMGQDELRRKINGLLGR